MNKQYKPSEKAENINRFIKQVFGKDREETIRNGQCVFCDNPKLDFNGSVEEKEYTISGICATCQRKTYKI